MIVALERPPLVTFLLLLVLATLILAAVGVAGNRLNSQRCPVYWW